MTRNLRISEVIRRIQTGGYVLNPGEERAVLWKNGGIFLPVWELVGDTDGIVLAAIEVS